MGVVVKDLLQVLTLAFNSTNTTMGKTSYQFEHLASSELWHADLAWHAHVLVLRFTSDGFLSGTT